jgi:hypothetical protein
MNPTIRLVEDAPAAGFEDDLEAALDAAEALPDRGPPAPSPIEAQWMRFRDQFAEAMDGGPYRIDDLEREVMSGEVYFWPGRNSALVARRVIYPSGEATMETLWAVGDVEEVITLSPGMEATARLLGCSAVMVEGRKGWERVLKPHGYEPWSVTLRKAL